MQITENTASQLSCSKDAVQPASGSGRLRRLTTIAPTVTRAAADHPTSSSGRDATGWPTRTATAAAGS